MTIDASLIQRAAAEAAGAQQYPKAALYVVATPIGNLADIGLRTLHVLALVDAVACEDKRVSAGLLRHFGIDAKPLLAVHAHNEAEAAQAVLARLAEGQRVAYVSDAGTPAISDPGARLVAAARAAGYRVLPLPGPSSVAAALSAAGDVQADGFRFVGFLPGKPAERAARLAELAAERATSLVLFEAPHRIAALADALAAAAPQRRLTVCRELTKQFEGIDTLTAADLPAWLTADANRARGEFVLVLHADPTPASEGELSQESEHLLRLLLAELPLKRAVALTAQATGAARNALYGRALEIQGDGAEAED